jgi:hypothetical protein
MTILLRPFRPRGYVIEGSGDYEASESDKMTKTQSGDRRLFTFSSFIRAETVGIIQRFCSGNGAETSFYVDASNRITINLSSSAYGATFTNTISVATWHHVLMQIDTANQITDAYLDGVKCTVSSGNTVPVDFDTGFNDGGTNYLGVRYDGAAHYFDGLMSETYWISGQKLPYTDFMDSGNAIEFAGSFGANDSYLRYQNSGDLGEDSSGNGNDWTNSGVTQSATVPSF